MAQSTAAPQPENEPWRLEALKRYRVLDTAPEQPFDDLARGVTVLDYEAPANADSTFEARIVTSGLKRAADRFRTLAFRH